MLQVQDASGKQLAFEAPLAAAEKVPGEALAVLHAMAYIGGLLGGSSHLHVKTDGSPQAAQPAADIIKDEVRGLTCGLVGVQACCSSTNCHVMCRHAECRPACNGLLCLLRCVAVNQPTQLPTQARCPQMPS